VCAIDPEIALLGPWHMRDIVGDTLGSTRLMALMMAVFGFLALGLGAVGIYGVTAQCVAEQRRDIVIRMALGAEATGVAGRTIVRGLVPVAPGVGVGLAIAAGGVGVLEELLYGVPALDPGTFVTAPMVLALVAVASLAFPAVRASRVDPVRTLREE
jgi:ABC-type antimicrobial peptide transport system permease subunit